jgi:hypothetical protein
MNTRTAAVLYWLFCVAVFLLMTPLLFAFSDAGTMRLPVYIGAVWLGIIILTAIILSGMRSGSD